MTNAVYQGLAPLMKEMASNLSAMASLLEKETTEPATEKEEPKKKAPAPKASKPKDETATVTIEQVRAALASKSQAGLTSQVKELLLSFGCEKLSGIDPERYGDLLKAASELQ